MGFGQISYMSTVYPGYNRILRKDTATIGTMLRDNGYGTSWFGKNHNLVGDDTRQWESNFFRNSTPIYPYVGKPGGNLTTAMADEAIGWLNQLNEIAPDKAKSLTNFAAVAESVCCFLRGCFRFVQ